MSLADFWRVIDEQLAELRTAATADDVLRILAVDKNPYGDPDIAAGEAFFAGSGGDETVLDALTHAGWTVVWEKAPYWWAMEAPNGDRITYVEGDIYRGGQ
jgi:hypothetical protein